MQFIFIHITYLIDESFNVGKGANSIISMLHHFFEHHGLGQTEAYLHADNCSGQNKNKIPIDVVYLDFSKAFDSVPHRRLLVKLQAHGIKGKLLNWIRAFLTDRRQRVIINK